MSAQTELPIALLKFNEPASADVDRGVELNELKLRELISVEMPSSSRPPHRRPGRVLALSCGLASVVLLAGIVFGVLGDKASPPADAGALAAVAERVSKLPDPAAMGPTDSYYTDLRSFTQIWVDPKQVVGSKPGQSGWVQFGRSRLETWLSRTGGLRSKMTPKQIKTEFPTEADRKNAELPRGGMVLGVSLPLVDDSHPARVFTVGNKHLDYEALTRLPSDPAALKTYLSSTFETPSNAGPSADEMRAATALLGYPLRTSVRAALFTVIAGLPGVTLKPGSTDALGRTGDAVSWIDKPYRQELIFDPNTGVDLETSRYLLEPELNGAGSRLKPGALESRETIAARGVVEEPRARIDPVDYAGEVRARTGR